ncbi:hypothetical protein NC653_022121 [Populus alba x Populus x berolinensis]|uniref:Uncharacterized protein n=1 Tax=Populus alba x Populus x berolinensis TaxID=444605 RepID=A0AAD6QFJ1_9ROSI|nr:hypothetical protein NC653_022119 [Populus alba x Populus x berolinensis]KAJ6989445.1 hypothetical protein NC653_022121 [Populus alba x Populus x berolinensis]
MHALFLIPKALDFFPLLLREIQFCAFLGPSRALHLCFEDKDSRERKNREGPIPTVHLELWPLPIECKVESSRFLFFFPSMNSV